MLKPNGELVTVAINNLSFRMSKDRYEKLTKTQLAVIQKYDMDNATGRSNSERTRDNQIQTLITLAIHTGKEFGDITKDDLNLWLMQRKGSSLERYKIEMKKFFRWFKKPELVEHLKSVKIEEKLTSEDMWSEQELLKLVDLIDADTLIGKRDQAIVMMMYDLMLERSAIANLNIEDIKDTENGMRVTVAGKKRGTIRKVVMEPIDSTLFIRKWLAVHPYRHNPKAPFFVSLSSGSYGQRLNDSYPWMLLQKLQKRSGIQKPIWTHLLRHSKATDLYRRGFRGIGLQKQMRHSSLLMQERYAHLCDEDANDERFELETGIDRKANRKQKKVLINITCPKCNTLNEATNLYCNKCSYALNPTVSTMENMISEVVRKIMTTNFGKMMKDECTPDELVQKYIKFQSNVHELEVTVPECPDKKEWRKIAQKVLQ